MLGLLRPSHDRPTSCPFAIIFYRFPTRLSLQDGSIDCTDEAGKIKHSNDNPFIEPVHGQAVVDMKGIPIAIAISHGIQNSFGCIKLHADCLFADVMVLNDIIEQAAGRQSRASDHGGMYYSTLLISPSTQIHLICPTCPLSISPSLYRCPKSIANSLSPNSVDRVNLSHVLKLHVLLCIFDIDIDYDDRVSFWMHKYEGNKPT